MTLTYFLLQILAFLTLYATSKKVASFPVQDWIHPRSRPVKLVGWLLLTLSYVGFVDVFGFASGLFTANISLMTIGSLIILLFPLFIKPVKD